MEGRAWAPGAGTVLNALATRRGCAFAIDEGITAHVTLEPEPGVTGSVADTPEADTALIEACVERTLERFGDDDLGGTVRTESELPMASGLKSSSAAANATVLATLAALDRRGSVDRTELARLGVAAARETGVTVTGAFDDATASMLGGVTLTDNDEDRLLDHERFEYDVAVYTPPERAYSADADLERCERIAPVARTVERLAREGAYGRAMIINGFGYAAALGMSTERMLEALPDITGVSLSGTGPSTVAVGTAEEIDRTLATWRDAPGRAWRTTTQNDGARII